MSRLPLIEQLSFGQVKMSSTITKTVFDNFDYEIKTNNHSDTRRKEYFSYPTTSVTDRTGITLYDASNQPILREEHSDISSFKYELLKANLPNNSLLHHPDFKTLPPVYNHFLGMGCIRSAGNKTAILTCGDTLQLEVSLENKWYEVRTYNLRGYELSADRYEFEFNSSFGRILPIKQLSRRHVPKHDEICLQSVHEKIFTYRSIFDPKQSQLLVKKKGKPLSIYPTATTGTLFVRIESYQLGAELTVYNAMTQPVFTQSLGEDKNQFSLELNELPKGHYFVVLNDNGFIHTDRFIKL